MPDDSEPEIDGADDEPGWVGNFEPASVRKFANDARHDEATGLIEACRGDETRRAVYRLAVKDSQVLDALGIKSCHSDASRAIEDAAAVVAAYAVARELANSKPTNASVRKALGAVIKLTAGIEAAERKIGKVLEGPGAHHARMLLEEAALNIAVKTLLPVKHGLPQFQRFNEQVARAKLLAQPLSRGMFTRHGQGILSRAGNNAPRQIPLAAGVAAARRHGLSVELERDVTEVAKKIPDMLWKDGATRYMMQAARAALATLDRCSEPSAYVVPPANLVLTFGGLELLCAWQPKWRPTTTADGKVASLIEYLRSCLPGAGEGDAPRETLSDVIEAWKLGRTAGLFDGRDPSRRERRDFQLDAHYKADYDGNPTQWT